MIQPRIEGRIELAAADDQAAALCELVTGAQHRVRIFSDTLSPALFDNIELAHELSRVARQGRQCEVQILIKNNGAPIPPEHVDKVFEPFFTTKRSGTGLGLATVKKIVEEHQGSIGISGTPGEGTTVTIRLPGVSRGPAHRYRGRGRRPPRRPTAAS